MEGGYRKHPTTPFAPNGLLPTDITAQHPEGRTGLMMSIRDGHYTTQPANISTQGEHRVNVAAMYDTENYRPKISKVEGTTLYLR